MQLIWFRRDLRLTDNPALTRALEQAQNNNQPLAAVFVETFDTWNKIGVSEVQLAFMHANLLCLKDKLNSLNVPLYVLHAGSFKDTAAELLKLCQTLKTTALHANSEYEVYERARDKQVTDLLAEHGVEFKRTHDQCVVPPGAVKTGSDEFYKVYSPFFKRWHELLLSAPPAVLAAPEPSDLDPKTQSKLPSTQTSFSSSWPKPTQETQNQFPAGEDAAHSALKQFAEDKLYHYKDERNYPAKDTISYLSAYLTLGVISAKSCYVLAQSKATDGRATKDHQASAATWIKELAWRDFYRHVLVGFPRVCKNQAFNTEADQQVNWSYNSEHFETWKQGNTGVPLVDAAMRCLAQTGFMHNRLRMVVAMYLTKDLLIDWRWGEAYFASTLIDFDFASNSGGWQWSASVGTDAAPYFRIMNPYTQGERFDADATFIKQWVPELKNVEAKLLHKEEKVAKHASTWGYAAPLVDHSSARKAAIEAFKLA